MTGHPGGPPRLWSGRAATRVALRPRLWPTTLAQLVHLARPGWWRRWPPIPAPDPDYLRFRLQTAYGEEGGPPRADDVVAYLEWCKESRHLAR